MAISKKYMDDLDTKLLNLAERLENKANDDAGDSDEQQARAEALMNVADLIREAKEQLSDWVEM